MALLVAPYNPAMRLGMGFNSFTQQLCINDSVQLSAESTDLQTNDKFKAPKYKTGLMTAEDGSENVSQSVTWSAKFVDRISEVTDSMNVSGSLQIKCDAIGGGGGASASFIDSNKFKESDINYFIQVKVTNQKLLAPDLTEFCPVPGVAPADFTRVYGDSFISGFIEGGEFNALVSIKLKDRSTAKDISGQLKVQLDLKGASVEGEAKAGVKKESKSIEGETTIAVSWTGGGDIKDEKVTDWTLETLKAVALEFPEHVMACPMRTSAILTKYTSLKSFQTHMAKMGSPLDYENAGVYSSALLDAYMDYKVMWRNIQQAAWELEHGQSTLERRPDIPQFAELARQARAHYDQAHDAYAKSLLPEHATVVEDDASEASAVVVVQRKKREEAPCKPNELVPYSADIFGLDKARRDCRFEMIKIVKEVDAVAADPTIATDSDRIWQYLSPSIFRMLLPNVKNLGKEQAAKEAAEAAVAAAAAQAKATESLNADLADVKRKLGSAENALRELRPYGDWCPVALGANVKLRSFNTGRVFDFNVGAGNLLRQWDSGAANSCQKYKIVRANSLGFHIIHVDTGRYLTYDTTPVADKFPRLVIREGFGSVFFFERSDDNTVLIRLADQPGYTVVPEGGIRENGARYLLWPGGKNINDKWCIDAWQ